MGSFETESQQAAYHGASRSGTCFAGGIGGKTRAGEKCCKLCSGRVDQSLYTRVRQHRKKIMGWLEGELHQPQAAITWCFLWIARSYMNDIYYMCVLGLVDDVEARVLQSSPQTIAPGSTPRAKVRPTQDGRRGLRRHRGRGGGCGANRFRQKTEGVFMF